MKTLRRLGRDILFVISWISAHLIGHIKWQAPDWLNWLRRQSNVTWRYFAADRKRSAALLLGVLALGIGTVWYLKRPTPHYVTYTVTPPALTEYNEKGISKIHSVRVDFSESTAPLKQIEKRVTAGIDMTPAIAGTWFWTSDRSLEFTPQADWPIDTTFSVSLAKKNFAADGVKLERYGFKFNSQPF